MNWQAILAALGAIGANIKGIASAYRLVVLSVLGLILFVAGVWAFIVRPQTLIVVVVASGFSYAYGPRFVSWVRGEA